MENGAANMTNRPKKYPLGIVIVHGIGHQKEGKTRDILRNSLTATFADLSIPSSITDLDSSSSEVLIGSRQVPVLVSEALWAPKVLEIRERHVIGWARRMRFLIAVIPFLLFGAVGPRGNDPVLAELSEPKSAIRASMTSDIGKMAPSLWRLVALAGLVAAVSLGFRSFPICTFGAVVVALLGVLIYLGCRGNLVEHVRLAAMGPHAIDELDITIAESIRRAESSCRKVWVIGHSQGGYLSHRILAADGARASRSRRHRSVARFIGVGSGLRPITMAEYATSSRLVTLYGWLMLVPAVLLGICMTALISPGGIFRQPLFETLIQALPVLLVMPRPEYQQAFLESLAAANWQWTFGGAWWFMAFVGSVIALILVRIKLAPNDIEIADLRPGTRWDEWTSPSDIVGSMGVPPLPREGVLKVLPSLRQTLFDHGLSRYLGERSALRFELCDSITQEISAATEESTKRAELISSSLSELDRSCYVLRGGLLATALIVALLLSFWSGEPMTVIVTWALCLGVGTTVLSWVIAWVRWGSLSKKIVHESTRDLRRRHLVVAAQTQVPIWPTYAVGFVSLIAVALAAGLTAFAAFAESFGLDPVAREQFFGASHSMWVAALSTAVSATLLQARIQGTWIALTVFMYSAGGAAFRIHATIPDIPLPLRPGEGTILLLMVAGVAIISRLAWARLSGWRQLRAEIVEQKR